jgi:hypothetical protein
MVPPTSAYADEPLGDSGRPTAINARSTRETP